MELDTRRKLIIGALDPRHNDADPAATGCPLPDGEAVRDPDCKSGFYVISYADPANLRQVGDFVSLPAGHTASCIQDCKYIWTGGRRAAPTRTGSGRSSGPTPAPSRSPRSTASIGDGRPIWVTDLPTRPGRRCPTQPIDLWRNDGYTDYSHDVDEDERGIAWVAGRGGIRGYATRAAIATRTEPRRGATPFEPILVAGGGVAWDERSYRADDGVAQPVMFMHNSGRPTDGSVRASGVAAGNVLIGTEEDFTTPCEHERPDRAVGPHRLAAAASRHSSPRGRTRTGWTCDSFHPFVDTPETANPALGCSAHYFEIEGPMLGAAWYGQGLRLLDVSDARDVTRWATTGSPARRTTTRRRTRGTSRSARIAAAAASGAATSCTCSTCTAASRCCGSGGARARRAR